MTRSDTDQSPKERALHASALVDAAKAGDQRAFAELVHTYRPRIYALALHLTGQHADAEDITQDAFLKAYTKLDQFEGRSQFFTWLYRIAMHRALNVKRYNRRRPTVPIDDPRLEAALEADATHNPERAMHLRSQYRLLLSGFDLLSDSLRTTLVLTVLQGLSHKETAVVLDTTEGTIAWRVHEARRKLRKHFEANETSTSDRRAEDNTLTRLKTNASLSERVQGLFEKRLA